jgi:uncharacterized membrane protein
MQGIKRRIFHTLSFEIIGLIIAIPLFAWVFDADLEHIGIMTVVMSLIAMVWNMAFNKLFELWEARQHDRRRTTKRRVIHALGFEGGLLVATLPLIAWWMQMNLWQALLTDLGYMLFFLVYGFLFNYGFDRFFGPPKLD